MGEGRLLASIDPENFPSSAQSLIDVEVSGDMLRVKALKAGAAHIVDVRWGDVDLLHYIIDNSALFWL